MSTRGDRWDRDRFEYEQDRFDRPERPPYGDKHYMRGGRGRSPSEESLDRRRPRAYDDDIVRDRRYFDDEPRYAPRREFAPEYQRRGPPVMAREREREYYPREASPTRPSFLRRQSSLDTFDRRPVRPFHQREEYPPPARREDIYRDEHRDDYRAPPYADIPLPKTKTKAIGPPSRYEDYEDIKVAEPDYYGDDNFRPYPDRVREREFVRERRDERHNDRSSPTRSARTRSHRASSPSSTTTSRTSSSSSDGGTTVKDEYPKKGRTRIPARLVSKRAIIDIGYPFTEEGNTIVVQKALSQDNIDALLKLSEDYKKSEMEVAAARSSAGNVVQEHREEIFVPPPPPAPAPVPVQVVAPAPAPAPAPGPVIVDAAPPRASSPTYTATSTTTSSYDTYYAPPHHHHHHHESSRPIPVGPVALAERSRSHSRGRHEIRAEIRALERELVHRPKHREFTEREIVRAERLPDGQLVVYEEEVEREHVPKPARIEKDKKGRLSLSVPRR